MNSAYCAQEQQSQHQCLCKSPCSLFLWWFVSLHLAGKPWAHPYGLWWLKPAAFPFCLSKSQTCHCFKKLLGSCLDESEGQLGKLNSSIFWKSSDRQPQPAPQASVIRSVLCLGPRDRPDCICPLNKVGVLPLPREPLGCSSFLLIQTKPTQCFLCSDTNENDIISKSTRTYGANPVRVL